MTPQSVPAVERTIDVFDAFRAARRPLSLSELARMTKIPVSTCHGIVRTLERRGLLYFTSQREIYPTGKLFEISREISAHDPIAIRLGPKLEALRDAVGETVILGIHQGDAVLYLLVLDSRQIVRYTARPGEFKPLHSSAIGKSLLGTYSDPDLAQWLAARDLPRVTDRTITSARQLKRELEESRSRGYFVTRGENVSDVMAIALPLRVGSAALGVAIAGPMHRMEPAETKLATALKKAVRQLAEIADV